MPDRTFMYMKPMQWGMLLLGLGLGETFPDLDLQFSFLHHRSIITHGIILPLLFFAWIRLRPQISWIRPLSLGFWAMVAVHLSFDLFPSAWQGFALIHIPGYGRTSMIFSWGWLMISVIGCMYLAMLYILSGMELIVMLIVIVTVIGIDQEPWLRPVIILSLAIVIAEGIEHGWKWLSKRIHQLRDK